MRMPVMGIGEMRMAVGDGQVLVRMRVARVGRHWRSMRFVRMVVVLVTQAVRMFMAVLQRLVGV